MLAARRGGDVELSWPLAAADLWGLYRDPAKDRIGQTPWLVETTARLALDSGAVARPGDDLYALRALSPCSKTPGP